MLFGGITMTIFLSFDDGRLDFYENVFPILKKYNQYATIHVTTGFVDGTYKTNDFGVNRSPVTIKQLFEMKQYGIEISSHGDKHILDGDDFENSRDKIIDWGLLSKEEKIGFSVPNSKYSNEQIYNFICSNGNFLKYVRVGRNPRCYRLFGKISYFFYHYIIKNKVSFFLFNRYNVFTETGSEEKLLYSLVVKKDCRLKHILWFLKKYSMKETNVVLMFHSIVNEPKDSWEWGMNDFEKLVEFCLENNIGIKRLEDL